MGMNEQIFQWYKEYTKTKPGFLSQKPTFSYLSKTKFNLEIILEWLDKLLQDYWKWAEVHNFRKELSLLGYPNLGKKVYELRIEDDQNYHRLLKEILEIKDKIHITSKLIEKFYWNDKKQCWMDNKEHNIICENCKDFQKESCKNLSLCFTCKFCGFQDHHLKPIIKKSRQKTLF